MAAYIGSLISLISLSDIRYQGILHSINPTDATVSLERVRSLGTEGRKGDPSQEIPGNDNVYDFIVFRAADVKDLQIESTAPTQPPNDPAIVGTGAPPPPLSQTQQQQQAPQQPQQQPTQQSQQSAQYSPQAPPPPQAQFGGPPGNNAPQPPFGPFAPYPLPPQGYGHYPSYGYGPPPGQFGHPGPFGPPPPGYGMPFGPPPGGFMGPTPPQQSFPPQHSIQSPSINSAVAPSPIAQNQPYPSPNTVQQVRAPQQPQPQSNGPLSSPGVPARGSPQPVASAHPSTQPNLSSAAGAADAMPSPPAPVTNGVGAKASPSAIAAHPTASEPSQKLVPAASRPGAGDARAPAARAAPAPAPAPAPKPAEPLKPRSYANPGPPHPVAGAPVPTTATAPAPAKLSPPQPRKTAGADVEQLAKDMSRANMGGRGGQSQQASRDGVGPSVFGQAGGKTGSGNRPPRALQPFGGPQSAVATLPASDFDFQSSNAAFQKDSSDDVVVPPAPAEAFYDKKASFFDSISSDIKARAEGGEGGPVRFDRGAERNRNMDTFGESGGNRGGGNFGRRGGRGGRMRSGRQRDGGPNAGVNNGLPRAQQ